jgi:hypothetical protein
VNATLLLPGGPPALLTNGNWGLRFRAALAALMEAALLSTAPRIPGAGG